jgi:hypothetical protein
MDKLPVYLEVGKKRVFAAALDWPGWCRSGRHEDGALQALVQYGRRYSAAVGRAARGLGLPADPSGLEVTERLPGDATTDFGAPGAAPAGDDRPLRDPELDRLQALLKAAWRAFDRAVNAAEGAVLRKGPRGGGRDLEAIVSHVLEADRAYLSKLGGKLERSRVDGPAGEMARLRREILGTLSVRAHGEPLPPSRRTSPLWAPRYAVRRSAWHALDHAWEIEDRAAPAPE